MARSEMDRLQKIIREAKPKGKPYMLTVGNGLYVEVHSNVKTWKFQSKIEGKRIKKTIGRYPAVTLAEAIQVACGMKQEADTGQLKSPKEEKASEAPKEPTLAEVVAEWLERKEIAPSYRRTVDIRLNRYILPRLGHLKLTEITPPLVLEICRVPEEMGLKDTAHRVKFLLGEIFAYAIETAKHDYNPVTAIGKRALKSTDPQNYRCITDIKEARDFVKACLRYDHPVTRCAMLFSILTLSRPGTVRKAEWDEIDLENGLWVVPPAKMKMKRPHIASLPTQLIEMLKTLRTISGHQNWLFSNIKFNGECMSDGTISKAFRKIGYGDKMVAHGVRGMGSTILREIGHPRDHVESQLAHQVKDKVEAAYNHAEYTLKRKFMMQAYADRLLSDDEGEEERYYYEDISARDD